MSEDIIRYDILVQNALRGVIRKVLSEVEKTGLPGGHHFFVTFATTAPGVRISNRLREQYPVQMTIVMQHQFWDLEVGETGFGIGLSFSDVPEKLFVPFTAVRGFYDPSVNFELEFDVEETEGANDDSATVETLHPEPVARMPAPAKPDAAARKPAKDDAEPAKAGGAKSGSTKAGGEKANGTSRTDDDDDTPGPGAAVVSLDSFRNKK